MENGSDETYYPLINDINFNQSLQNHPRFSKFKYQQDTYTIEEMIKQSTKKCSDTGGYIFKNIQLFVSSFLSMDTPYNGLLLYHGVGVGKSCSSVLIANNFKEYAKKNNKKIIILTKANVIRSFRNEIFDSVKEDNKINKNEFICTSNEYLNEWNTFIKENPNYKDKLENFKDSIIDENFEIVGYTTFVNRYKQEIKTKDGWNKNKINEIFADSVLIIDEVHNLRDIYNDEDDTIKKTKESKESKESEDIKDSKNIIQNIIKYLNEPIKLILLSATPMYDRYEEFEYIINLLLENDKRELLNRKIIENYITNPNEIDEQIIINHTRGYISYIKGNDPTIFPLVLNPEYSTFLGFKTNTEKIITTNKMQVILCPMKEYQKNIYLDIKKSKDKKFGEKKKFSNLTFPKNEKGDLLTFDDIFEENNNIYSLKNEELGLELLNNIEKYSTKIHKIIENINNSKGKTFIYSEYKLGDYGGSRFLSIILEHYGYIRKNVNGKNIEIKNKFKNAEVNDENHPNFKGYYISVAGLSDKIFDTYINYFNDNNNIYGEKIKIIIGTENMIEGVSLKNMRQIHILEPWYNISRHEQINGRGIRQCSHIKLPFEERNITIFNYIAIANELEKKDNLHIVPYYENPQDLEVDLRKLQRATEKQNKIELIENILQKNAIDCFLNESVNNINITLNSTLEPIEFKDSFNKSVLISYNNIEKNNCIGNFEPYSNEELDIQNTTFLNKNLIKNIKFFIKTIFTKGILHDLDNNIKEKNKIYYSYNDLFNELKLYNNQINETLFKYSLQELILNKELFYDKFNKQGYIIMKGKYFIFKNNNISNIDLPIEFNIYPFNNKINKIYNYNDYSIELFEKKNSIKTLKNKEIKNKSDTIDIDTKNKETKDLTNEEALDELLNSCAENNLNESLKIARPLEIYKKIWNKLEPDKGKKELGVVKLFDKENVFIEKEARKEVLNNMFKFIFGINKNETIINEEFFTRIYDSYYILPFLFNFSDLIIVHLKCIFYRVYIKKIELTPLEQKIHDHYCNLLVSVNDPLIFKFIEYSKDSTNKYTYEFLGLIYYEYDEINNKWFTHNKTYKSRNLEIDSIKGNKKLNLFKILYDSGKNKDLTNPIFIKKELKISNEKVDEEEENKNIEFDFKRIYDSFDYNNYYYSQNNGYYKYSGNPFEPFNYETKHMEKFSNIMGLPILSFTDKSQVSYLSRHMFTLGIIYSPFYTNQKNCYLKTAISSLFPNLTTINKKKGSLSEPIQKYFHIVYCILDQVEELNMKLLFEMILYNLPQSFINDLWDREEPPIKYDIKNILENRLKNIIENIRNNDNYLDQETLDEIIEYIEDIDSSIEIKSLEDINKKINEMKYKFYIDLESIYNMIDLLKNNYTVLSSKMKERENKIVQLMIYILYELENYKKNDTYKSFYNKKWLFSILEASLLNAKLLKLKTIDTKNLENIKETTRLAESSSITHENTFILAKKIGKAGEKYKETDT